MVTVRQVDDPAAEGEVVAVDPDEGSEVEVGSEVTLSVSAGNIVTVPDVVGDSEQSAQGALSQAGFQVSVQASDQAPSEPDQVGTVQSQSPGGDETAERGSTVTIFVYQEGADLEVSEPVVDGQDVTIQWDNGIYGGVTIDWGDDTEDTSSDAQGEESHTYPITPTPTTYTITVTATDHEGRTQSYEVEIDPGP